MSERTRAEQIAGIHQLAVWLEQNPDVPIPSNLAGHPNHVGIHVRNSEDQKAIVAAIARALPGQVEKSVFGADNEVFGLDGIAPGGIGISVYADRDAVCKRVVTGTREVTKTIPDPTAPTIEVTETVEDIEWVCEPLLSERERKAIEDETVRAVLES